MSRAFHMAVVNSHPIQYFAPLYAFLNRDPVLAVTALYCSDFGLRGAIDPGFKQAVTWDVDLLTGYRSVFLGENAKQRTPGICSARPPRLRAPRPCARGRCGTDGLLWMSQSFQNERVLPTARLPSSSESRQSWSVGGSALREHSDDVEARRIVSLLQLRGWARQPDSV